MAKRERNAYLEASASEDESDVAKGSSLDGYDSEEAERGLARSKGRKIGDVKGRKRQKMSPDDDDSDEVDDDEQDGREIQVSGTGVPESIVLADDLDGEDEDGNANANTRPCRSSSSPPPLRKTSGSSKTTTTTTKRATKPTRPGIIYLPSLPPHLKPSALKNLLEQRGFSPINRLFLTPSTPSPHTSNHKSSSSSRSRKLYTEGWVEFPSHRTAKRCVSALNATIIGGPKRGYYHDDLWNMRYLRGMTWTDLMGQIREERREQEVRKGEERRTVKREVETFLRGVERGKRERTQLDKEERKRRRGGKLEGHGEGDDDGVEEREQIGTEDGAKEKKKKPFQWEQFRVVGSGGNKGRLDTRAAPAADDSSSGAKIDEATRRVLGRIF